MDDATRTIALRYLVAQYLQSVKDVQEGERRLVEVKEAVARDRNRQGSYSDTLRTEGIDPNNIPPHLIGNEADSTEVLPMESEETEPWLQDDDTISEKNSLVTAENNGHAKTTKWPTPLNDTHAVFLVFKNLNNPWLNSEEIYQHNVEMGYGLYKSEVLRIVGRQMSRPQKLMWKQGDRYQLSPAGLTFAKFRKGPDKQEEAETSAQTAIFNG